MPQKVRVNVIHSRIAVNLGKFSLVSVVKKGNLLLRKLVKQKLPQIKQYISVVYRICSRHKLLVRLVRDVNALKRWKEHFSMVFDRIKIWLRSTFVDEMTSHNIIQLKTAPPNRKESISAINAELSIAVSAVSAKLLLSLIRKSWKSEIFPSE